MGQDLKAKVSISSRLKMCFDEWKKLTSDKWVLETVLGYKIIFDKFPTQRKYPNKIAFSDEEKSLIDKEVQTMLDEGAILPSNHEKGQFISNIFLVPKPNGKYRPVINLRQLNEYVHYEKFKQETFPFVLELIQQNDYFASLDLKSAYFSIPIHKESIKYLKFEWRDQLYAFVSLCFGLSSAPFCFTKVLKPLYSFFRQLGIRCAYYIDDSINMHQQKHTCLCNTILMKDKLESLGFVINEEKSVFIPTQRIKYFGFIIDSVLFKVFLTEKKIVKIETMAHYLLDKKSVKVRELASFIGLLINAFYAILEAPMHYRVLERYKVRTLESFNDFDSDLELDYKSLEEIKWWSNNVRLKNGKKIRQSKISLNIQSDASLKGYGSFCVEEGQRTGGRWSSDESMNHINYLELLAIFFALKSWVSNRKGLHVAVQSDNTTAISYINNMGGMHSELMDSLSKTIWEWCLKRQIFITAFHLPGIENIQADIGSREFSDTTEWMLKKQIFR